MSNYDKLVLESTYPSEDSVFLETYSLCCSLLSVMALIDAITKCALFCVSCCEVMRWIYKLVRWWVEVGYPFYLLQGCASSYCPFWHCSGSILGGAFRTSFLDRYSSCLFSINLFSPLSEYCCLTFPQCCSCCWCPQYFCQPKHPSSTLWFYAKNSTAWHCCYYYYCYSDGTAPLS